MGALLYLGLLIGVAASSGISGVLVLVGLPLLIVGAIAGFRGHVGWARLATRRAGWLLAAAGLLVTGAGSAIASADATSSSPPSTPHTVAQAPARRALAAVPTTTTPVPTTASPSATTAKTSQTTHATAKPSPSATKSKSAPKPKPSAKPKPKPVPTTAPKPAHHACTLTSGGNCIQGGEFCPKASIGQSGYDAAGRRYVCKGSNPSHPHWEIP